MNFKEKILLKDNVYWTAEYQSFDQRHGDIYYVITLHKKEEEQFAAFERFGVRISEYSKGKRSEEEFLKEELSKLAEGAKTNIPSTILWKGIGNDNIDKL